MPTAKNIETNKGHKSKDEKKTRKKTQDEIKGGTDKLTPPNHLTVQQKKFYKEIVKNLENADILGNNDLYVLETTCIAIDNVRRIHIAMNENEALIFDSKLMATREKFMKDLYAGINHFGMSPTARAKLGSLEWSNKQKQKDPLLNVVGE